MALDARCYITDKDGYSFVDVSLYICMFILFFFTISFGCESQTGQGESFFVISKNPF